MVVSLKHSFFILSILFPVKFQKPLYASVVGFFNFRGKVTCGKFIPFPVVSDAFAAFTLFVAVRIGAGAKFKILFSYAFFHSVSPLSQPSKPSGIEGAQGPPFLYFRPPLSRRRSFISSMFLLTYHLPFAKTP